MEHNWNIWWTKTFIFFCSCLRFPNLAQTCYMNSTLQALLTLRPFIQEVNSHRKWWQSHAIIKYSTSHTLTQIFLFSFFTNVTYQHEEHTFLLSSLLLFTEGLWSSESAASPTAMPRRKVSWRPLNGLLQNLTQSFKTTVRKLVHFFIYNTQHITILIFLRIIFVKKK